MSIKSAKRHRALLLMQISDKIDETAMTQTLVYVKDTPITLIGNKAVLKMLRNKFLNEVEAKKEIASRTFGYKRVLTAWRRSTGHRGITIDANPELVIKYLERKGVLLKKIDENTLKAIKLPRPNFPSTRKPCKNTEDKPKKTPKENPPKKK